MLTSSWSMTRRVEASAFLARGAERFTVLQPAAPKSFRQVGALCIEQLECLAFDDVKLTSALAPERVLHGRPPDRLCWCWVRFVVVQLDVVTV